MNPIVRGLYLAGRVDADPVTRNLTLVNCFRTLFGSGSPVQTKPFFVVAYLANGLGRVQFRVGVSRLDTLADIYEARAELDFTDRLRELRLVLRIEQCVFPVPGEYEASLWVGPDLLTQTPFTLRARENPS
jgi:hypothetical protein